MFNRAGCYVTCICQSKLSVHIHLDECIKALSWKPPYFIIPVSVPPLPWGVLSVLSSVHFFFQSLQKAVPKNSQTTTQLHSSHTLVMFKILQARLQQYMNRELPDVQAGFQKGRGTRDQVASFCWITRKAREFQKNIYFCFVDYANAFDCLNQNKQWRILKEMGIPDYLTCLLRNLQTGQEATVRNRHGTTDWFQIWKGVFKGCILSSCLLNICRVHLEKRRAGRSTSWNQDCWKKYQ